MDYIPGRDGEGTPRVLACFMSALLNREPMQLVDGGMARRTIVSIYEAWRRLRESSLIRRGHGIRYSTSGTGRTRPTIPLDEVLHDTMTYFHHAYAPAMA